jgi:hypothetical protein
MCYRAGASHRELAIEEGRRRLGWTAGKIPETGRNLRKERKRERATSINLVGMLSSICLPCAWPS